VTNDHPLLERAREAPESPGVYRFRDAKGRELYIGKARHLRRRVLSYFGRSDLPERTLAMVARARDLSFTVTASEVEAFILENTLIKRLRPRFNVLLRDDKTYPYIKLTTGEAWPRVLFTRVVRDDGHTYFGPFMGQRMARRLMDLARTHFQVRTCHIEIDGRLPRPCLYYHMKACLGPCVDGLTDSDAYAGAVDELKLFLGGRHRELLPRLETSMWTASKRENFELASRYRDLIAVVRRLGEPQDVEQPGRGDADVFAVYTDGEHASVCVLPYRTGKLVDKREFHFEGVGDVGMAELLSSFTAQYYDANPAIPRTVETSVDLDEALRWSLPSVVPEPVVSSSPATTQKRPSIFVSAHPGPRLSTWHDASARPSASTTRFSTSSASTSPTRAATTPPPRVSSGVRVAWTNVPTGAFTFVQSLASMTSPPSLKP